ncbi:hypothetical protein PYJP_17060 [Pyrofollis japonicus]|uniref:hypothetical protein n=1 Tax=Pyrofollis japonicus TaxID=3060460 RepID=UPI00295BD838|nr:hypothetical protein [Pyrofollis japonicus]BEP18354.1 hypothetical protein PYJP_17060 [Pyrofollis japonicus]
MTQNKYLNILFFRIANIFKIITLMLTIYISLNTLISHLLILTIGLSLYIIITVIATSLFLVYLILRDLKKSISLNFVYKEVFLALSIVMLMVIIIGIKSYKLLPYIWDQNNIISQAFYIIVQGKIPRYQPASIDPAFYPLGSAIIISLYSTFFIKTIPLIKHFDTINIVENLHSILHVSILVSSFFISLLIFGIFLSILGIIFNIFSNIDKILYIKNKREIYVLIIILTILIVSALGYVLSYPINSNAIAGALYFITFITAYNLSFNKKYVKIAILILILYSLIMFHYTFLATAIIYIILSLLFNIIKKEYKSNIYKKLIFLIVFLFIFTLALSKSTPVFKAYTEGWGKNVIPTWKYLQPRKNIPYLEIEPGVLGKTFDPRLYVRYKFIPYTKFLVNAYLKATQYFGTIFYILAIIGFYQYIKNNIIIYKKVFISTLFFSIALITVTPFLLFTRIYILIMIVTSIFSSIGFLSIYLNNKKTLRLIIILIIVILFFTTIIHILKINPPIQRKLINVDLISNLYYLVKNSKGRVLLPATPEANILWGLFPQKVLGCDPRHVMIKTRVYTSILFDICYTAVGKYNFSQIPFSIKKYILDKYEIKIIFSKPNMIITKRTASELKLISIGSIGEYKVWIRVNDP